MKVNEITNLFERIKKHYNNFGYDDAKVQEWHRFLKNYSSKSILDNLDDFILEGRDRPPIIKELIRGAEKEEEKEPVTIQCDICKKGILVGDNWDDFEKHYRKCQKIDFIDRMCLRYKQDHIERIMYYEMSDEELDRRYRKIMDFYLQQPKEGILKKL